MTLSGKISLPLLRGTLLQLTQWDQYGKSGYRIYPFKVGAMVRSGSTGTTISTDGLGELAQNDYIMICSESYYGDTPLFVPDTGRIVRVTSDPSAAVDDTITVDEAVTVYDGEWILVLGADTAGTPKASPNYDGSGLTLYSDNAGNTSTGLKYLQTGAGGRFHTWLNTGRNLVDLLVMNSSNVPQVVLPLVALGPEIDA